MLDVFYSFRNCSLAQMFRADSEIKGMCINTNRVRYSKYKPHYGNKAAARNLQHRQAHTHGL